MFTNKQFIEEIINNQIARNNLMTHFAVRNKASPIEQYGQFQPYSPLNFKRSVYKKQIDGVKMKFTKYVTIEVNGRYKNK